MKYMKFHIGILLYAILIFVQSSIPGDSLPDMVLTISDKVIHFGMYFVFFVLVFISIYHFKNIHSNKFVFFYSFMITILFGAFDEIHQYFVPNRSCDIFDFIADAIGALAGILIILIYLQIRKNKLATNNI